MKKLKNVFCVNILITLAVFASFYTVQASTDIPITVSITIATDDFANFHDKSLLLQFSNVEGLQENCVWGISKTKNKMDVENWYPLENFNIKDQQFDILLDVDVWEKNDIQRIIKATDILYVYLKDTTDNFIINGIQVDITLPLFKAFSLHKSIFYDDGPYNCTTNPAYYISPIYGIENYYYTLEKVTDEAILQEYQTNHDLTTLENKIYRTEIPQTDWIGADFGYALFDMPDVKSIPNAIFNRDSGLYYLWIKAKDEDSKAIYGLAFLEVSSINLEPTPEFQNEITSTTNTSLNTNLFTEKNKENNIDTTVIPQKELPQTGENFLIIGCLIIAFILGILLYIKNREAMK